MTDTNELLRQYAENASEAAFRELVQRYVDLVYSAAVRRTGGNAHLAQDVVQAVFTDLARKASMLAADTTLGGWLHHHTGFVAANLMRGERRRKVREEQAALMNASPSEPGWKQIAPVLDEAIDRLEPAERDAVVMRFFERRDFRAVGAVFGVSDDAAQKRVSRAVDKLRVMLAERGVTLSLTAVSVALVSNAVTAAPLGLAAAITRSALARAARLSFQSSILQVLSSGGFKWAAGSAILAVLGVVTWNLRQPGKAARPAAPLVASTQGVPTVSKPNEVSPEPAAPASAGLLKLTLLSATDDRPVPDVPIKYSAWTGTNRMNETLRSAANGTCEVGYPGNTKELLLITEIDGFADAPLRWLPSREETIPASYTLRLPPAMPIGGRVLDAADQPVANAKIEFQYTEDPEAHTPPESFGLGFSHSIRIQSDDQGRWSLNRISVQMLRRVTGDAVHPEHQDSPMLDVARDSASLSQLCAGEYVFRLGRAATATGVVIDPEGKPVLGAEVMVSNHGRMNSRHAVSSPDGAFAIAGCSPGTNCLTASAPGFATVTIQIALTNDGGPYQLTLQRGRPLRVRVTDQDGRPIHRAFVRYDEANHDGYAFSVQADLSGLTDEEGRVMWEHAPEVKMAFNFRAAGRMERWWVPLAPASAEHQITLFPALKISGTVRDAVTGQTIPKFRMLCGYPDPWSATEAPTIVWKGCERFWRDFDKPDFQQTFEEVLGRRWKQSAEIIELKNPGYVLKFQAKGYAPFETRIIRAEEGAARFDVRLRPSEASVVTVLLPDGAPAAEAEVFLVPNISARISNPRSFSRRHEYDASARLRLDAQGHFRLEPDVSILRVVIAHPSGYLETPPSLLAGSPTLWLRAWGKIEGILTSGGQPAAGRRLRLEIGNGGQPISRANVDAIQFDTDERGEFFLPEVPTGRHKLIQLVPQNRSDRQSWSLVPLTDVEISAGENKTMTLEESR